MISILVFNVVIIVVGIICWVAFMILIVMTCRGWNRVYHKYFAAPPYIYIPKQAKLDQCWDVYGEKDARGEPRPASLAELRQLWRS